MIKVPDSVAGLEMLKRYGVWNGASGIEQILCREMLGFWGNCRYRWLSAC